MNYWLDPERFDEPEPPECCGDYMDVLESGDCVCPSCGKLVEMKEDERCPSDYLEQ